MGARGTQNVENLRGIVGHLLIDLFQRLLPPIHHHTKIVPMTNIKILSTGCANCKATQKLVEDVIKAKGVHAGGIPGRAQVEQWIGA